MPVFEIPSELIFPSPEHAEPDGLLGIGGDLSPERILLAYSHGIFPWFSDGEPILWWSPNPRCILLPEELKLSKSLKQKIKQAKFEIRYDTVFEQVILNCAKVKRNDHVGTWITTEMQQAYITLHQSGFAHSVEVFMDGELAGGLYGIALGKVFFGESMFYLKPDASKIAFYFLVERLKEKSFQIIDCQVVNSHLLSLGAKEMDRTLFLKYS